MFALTKIEIEGEKIDAINARSLHEFLGVKTEFKDWIVRRIEEYGFFDGRDFSSFLSESIGGRPAKEYVITVGMAKELSMVEKNEKGKQARQYFIECERIARSRTLPAYVPTYQIQNKQADNPVIPIQFNNDTIYLIEHNGEPYTLIHPILENIGIEWTEQYTNKYIKIPKNTSYCVVLQPKDSQDKMLCIPVKKLDEFLSKTDTWKMRRLNQNLATWKLIAYKNECVNALYVAWFNLTKEI